jgi:Pou domain - N-terminal to homeobox domain
MKSMAKFSSVFEIVPCVPRSLLLDHCNWTGSAFKPPTLYSPSPAGRLERPLTSFLPHLEQPALPNLCLSVQQSTAERKATASQDNVCNNLLPVIDSSAVRARAQQTGSVDCPQQAVNAAELKELERFASSFKARRIRLGFTQTNVG